MQALQDAPPNPAMAGNWQGHIAIGFGIGIFRGLSGDNHPHRHLAHQLSFSLDDHPLNIICNNEHYHALGLFIPAATLHHMPPQHCCSIYLDHTHPLSSTLLERFEHPTGIYQLPDDFSQLLQHYFQTASTAQAALAYIATELNSSIQPLMPVQLQLVLQQLYQGALQADIPDLQHLAALVHLSPSRFSHWFAQHTGIPLRTYRKWLRLICSLQYLQQPHLTDVAHQARFADQAHFSRTCMQMFGVRPSDLQGISHIELMTSLPAS